MKIVVSCDHTGFSLVNPIIELLTSLGHQVYNLAPQQYDADDDYPDYIYPAARMVANGQSDRAIIVGGSGQAEAITANRLKGIRAALFYGPVAATESIDIEGSKPQDNFEIIRLSRQHNNANVLSLAARFMNEDTIKKAITIWLDEPFSNADRHFRRIKKIDGEL